MGVKPITISYVALAAVSGYAVYDLGLSFATENPLFYAVFGYVLILLTALMGVAKFAMGHSGGNFDNTHLALCWMSTSLIVALIGGQAMIVYGYSPYHFIVILVGIAVVPAKWLLSNKGAHRANGLSFSLGILVTLLVAILNVNIWGVVGAASLLFGRIQSSGESEDVEYDPVKDMQQDELFVGSYAVYAFCMYFFLTKAADIPEMLEVPQFI